MHWNHEPDWTHSIPGMATVKEKRGHVPAVQKTLPALDCGGTTPLSLHGPLAPDVLELLIGVRSLGRRRGRLFDPGNQIRARGGGVLPLLQRQFHGALN